MLYAGGDCTLSANCQPDDKFFCEDFNGGPPSTFGEPAYIVATDRDEEEVYFEGFVNVGSSYIMDNNMERFPADQTIKVYSDSDKTNLLQDVQYHSSCSQNLDLLNRFGSHGQFYDYPLLLSMLFSFIMVLTLEFFDSCYIQFYLVLCSCRRMVQ